MGEVYRGRDARLGRDVALKVISPKRGRAPRLGAASSWTRAASALNHPAIVTVYESAKPRGRASPWRGRGPDAPPRAGRGLLRRGVVRSRAQIADGLAGARQGRRAPRPQAREHHGHGDGRAKILDFGLARLTRPRASGADVAVETMETPPDATLDGTILGTVGYMSPEQAPGGPGLSLGSVRVRAIVYEMRRPPRLPRPSAAETLTAIIRDDPAPLESLRPHPGAAHRATAPCLSKRPEDRFASTRELAAALDSIGTRGPRRGRSAPPTEEETLVSAGAQLVKRPRLRHPALIPGAVLLSGPRRPMPGRSSCSSLPRSSCSPCCHSRTAAATA